MDQRLVGGPRGGGLVALSGIEGEKVEGGG